MAIYTKVLGIHGGITKLKDLKSFVDAGFRAGQQEAQRRLSEMLQSAA